MARRQECGPQLQFGQSPATGPFPSVLPWACTGSVPCSFKPGPKPPLPLQTAGAAPVERTAAAPAPGPRRGTNLPCSHFLPLLPLVLPRPGVALHVVWSTPRGSCALQDATLLGAQDRWVLPFLGSDELHSRTATAGGPDDLTQSIAGYRALIYLINSGPRAGEGKRQDIKSVAAANLS